MGLRKNFTLRSAAAADVPGAFSDISAGEWTRLTRRQTLLLSTLAALQAFGVDRRAFANQERETHGLSAFGDLKYPADFKHLDFVNPDAPKGGTFSQIGASRIFNQNFVTFNSLNSYIVRGDAALGIEL